MSKSKKVSIKAETLKLTGWTEAEYRRRYDIFRRKTATYNHATGSSFSAAKELFYSVKYAGNPSISAAAIAQSPLRYGQTAERIAVTAIVARFSGLIANGSDDLKNAVNLALNGEITAAQLRLELERYAESLRAARMSNPLVGADEV